MKNIIYPDYNNCNLNLITSILKHYNVKTNHDSLEIIDEKLKNNYKNVVLIVLDGMGKHILDKVSKNGFLNQHNISTLTSVYPSTTTASLTTYYSGLSPYESGWIGWSQYFKEYGRAIDMFKHTESYKGDSLKDARIDVFKELVNYETIFEKIENASPDTKAYEIEPNYAEKRAKRRIVADTIEDLCEAIQMLCSTKDKKFIFAYYDKPDSLLHKYGTTSHEVKDMILNAEKTIENSISNLSDSLVIISADHGHKDIDKIYSFLDYPELFDMLITPPSLEARITSLWVKENKKKDFEKAFNKLFKNEFLLLSTEKALEMNLFGYGKKHKKLEDFLGNYISISISSSAFVIDNYLFSGKEKKKSTHCGLTKEEMEIPLIVF